MGPGSGPQPDVERYCNVVEPTKKPVPDISNRPWRDKASFSSNPISPLLIAKESVGILYWKFLGCYEEIDFVGMHMVKKFIQMASETLCKLQGRKEICEWHGEV